MIWIALLGGGVYYFAFGGKEKLAVYLYNKKSLAEKVEMTFKKDFSPEYADAAFYIGNNYRRRYSQREWQAYYKENVDPSLDKNSQEYCEAVAPMVNAVVVDKHGYYLRRGMEDMRNKLTKFLPGVNDDLSLNYAIEPYHYVRDPALAAKSLAEEALREKKFEEEHGTWQEREAARQRCTKCANFTKCTPRVREQTGPCGGYRPK